MVQVCKKDLSNQHATALDYYTHDTRSTMDNVIYICDGRKMQLVPIAENFMSRSPAADKKVDDRCGARETFVGRERAAWTVADTDEI